MAPPPTGRKSKNIKKVKNDARTLKRKRDVEDLEKLQKAIDELVSIAIIHLDCRPSSHSLRMRKQK